MANLIGKTAYSKKEREFFCPTGDGFEDEWENTVDKDGKIIPHISGRKDLYSEIQSYEEECLIENILKRASIGDMSGFKDDGMYMDTTEIPANMIEAKKKMVEMENYFNKLPAEIKEKFNFSVEEFINEAGTEVFNQKLERPILKQEEPTAEVKEEKKNEE